MVLETRWLIPLSQDHGFIVSTVAKVHLLGLPASILAPSGPVSTQQSLTLDTKEGERIERKDKSWT